MNSITSAMVRLAVFYVTAPTREVAVKLSEILLNKKLVACCQIIDPAQAIYFWKGNIMNENEVLMILKSREELAN